MRPPLGTEGTGKTQMEHTLLQWAHQLGTLEYRHGHIIYAVEALESLIGFIQIGIAMQELINPFFDNRSF